MTQQLYFENVPERIENTCPHRNVDVNTPKSTIQSSRKLLISVRSLGDHSMSIHNKEYCFNNNKKKNFFLSNKQGQNPSNLYQAVGVECIWLQNCWTVIVKIPNFQYNVNRHARIKNVWPPHRKKRQWASLRNTLLHFRMSVYVFIWLHQDLVWQDLPTSVNIWVLVP